MRFAPPARCSCASRRASSSRLVRSRRSLSRFSAGSCGAGVAVVSPRRRFRRRERALPDYDRSDMTGGMHPRSTLTLAGLLAALSMSLTSCARREAPAPASEALPAPSAVPKAAARGELPTSLRDDISTMDAAHATAALADAVRALDDTLALATPDCPTARALRDRICELSTKLCALSGAQPGPEIAAACADGRARCDRAKERVSAGCP